MIDEKENNHKSYGAISLSRITSRFTDLFGSSIETNSAIAIRINHACEVNSFGKTRHRKKDRIVEAYLTPNQFSELLTTMSVSEGVPCTIKWLQGEGSIPSNERSNSRKITESYMKEIISELVIKIKELQEFAESLNNKKTLSKKDKEKLKKDLNVLGNHMSSNIPFVETVFNEVMDKTVTEAKADIDAFVTNTIIKYGFKELNLNTKLLEDTND